MPSDTTVLAFDTSAAHCAAALLRGDDIITVHAEAMSRGQAERLMPLLEDLLIQADCKWADLDAIGVGTGPGNFTGIRISVSAARGLALGLSIPAVGVTGFEVLRSLMPRGTVPAISAPRDQVYVQTADNPPQLVARNEADALGKLFFSADPSANVRAIAKISASRWTDVQTSPAPFYLRQADAAPSSDVPPVLLDG